MITYLAPLQGLYNLIKKSHPEYTHEKIIKVLEGIERTIAKEK